MTTPWGIELDQDILGIIVDNVLVVVGNDNSDRTIVLLWYRLALDGWLNLASNEIIDKRANVFLGDLLGLVEGELLVLGNVLDSKGWPLVSLEIEVTSVSSKGLGVNCCKVNLTIVFLGNRLECSAEFLTLLGSLSEDVS